CREFGGGCVEPSRRAAHRHAAYVRKTLEPDPSRRPGMIPQNFEYSAPTSLKEALALIAKGDAKVLAGGMSLVPMMKLRLAAPEHIVDLSRIADLKSVREDGTGEFPGGALHLGALTTHFEIEASAAGRGRFEHWGRASAEYGNYRR